MLQIILATFVISRTAIGMCAAGIIVFLLGLWSVRTDIVKAHGLEKIVTLTYLCVAIPLAVFGALHLFAPQFILPIVPPYMPWRMFWVYFIGCALIAASLSIATKVGVRWSGLLFGIVSLRQMEKLFQNTFNRKLDVLFVVPVMALNSFGVFVGRYLRFNSWDVITNPLQLIHDIVYLFIHPIRNRFDWSMIICYTVLLTLIYYTIKKVSKSL